MKTLFLLLSLVLAGAGPIRPQSNVAEVKPSLVIPTTDFGRMKISDFGVDLIVHFEVGGRAYYTKAYSRPIHPGNAASGVTIGIGYDLRFSSRSQIASDWGPYVSTRAGGIGAVSTHMYNG